MERAGGLTVRRWKDLTEKVNTKIRREYGKWEYGWRRKDNVLKEYIEGFFFYFASVTFIQYYMMLIAGIENRNCMGKKKRNKLLWLLPKEMCCVTLFTKAVLIGTEVFDVIGIVMLVTGELIWSFFVMELFISFFFLLYFFAMIVWIDKKIKGKLWKRFMEGQECETKPLKVQIYGSGLKGLTYSIIIKAFLLCIMNVVYLLRDPSPFIPFIRFLEWLFITGLEAYLGIFLLMVEKGFRRMITVEGGQAVYKDSRGKCRKFPVSDLCWMDMSNGIIKVLYKKEELIDAYVIYAHGVKEFCSVVEEVEWKEPED